MQLIFSTLLSLCSGAEKLRSILSKSCGVYLCAIVKWLFLPFCAFRASGVPNGLKDAVGTGNALLVYQRGQDISVGPVEGNCGRTVGDIPDSRSSTLVRHCRFRSKQLLFRVKKWWLYTRGDITDWSRVRKATFFTRCISPGSSATHCLIWQRWRLDPLHTDSCAGLSTVRNYLNISVIREMLANSYIVS